MSVTAGQISTYLTNIRNTQTIFMNNVIVKERLGFPDIVSQRVIASVLTAYVSIIEKYFSQPVYIGGYFSTNYNFYDEEEVEDVMLRINKICDTNYYLDL